MVICPSDSKPMNVRSLAGALVRHWGRGKVAEEVEPNAPHEAHYLKLDSSLAAVELGWTARLSPDERIAWTVEWYKAWHADPASAWATAAEQIERYEALLESTAQK